MPQLLSLYGYKVYFWSNEGSPIEPIHVHVSKTPHQHSTKIWIHEDGSCSLANNQDNIPNKVLNKILRAITDFSPTIINEWQKIFQGISYHQEHEGPTRD